MNRRKTGAVLAVCLAAALLLLWTVFPFEPLRMPDAAAMNHLAKSLEKVWRQGEEISEELLPQEGLQYYILDGEGRQIHASRELRERPYDAGESLRRADTVIEIKAEGKLMGKAVFVHRFQEQFEQNLFRVKLFASAALLLSALIPLLLIGRFRKRVILPLRNLEQFAGRIAEGNLEMPLSACGESEVGALAESFDRMRAELLQARRREALSSKRKKELTASLSHDIRTPVASIKAAAELLSVGEREEQRRRRLLSIMEKADQIHLLADNLLQSAMEELEELQLSLREEPGRLIQELVAASDYKNRVLPFEAPSCLILADRIRLAQVFDNIINNSYKYADTPIEVSCAFEESCLCVSIRDFGRSVSEEETRRLTEKFYRGKNAAGIEGSGLGLYISKHILMKMKGNLEISASEDGFCVRLTLPLL
ncbi:MAG: HAMP domain-containing sensor histidine kinase [Peptostreptococcaceae bacterium]|nr:HAMP domain-containing sensor histidine kinase [Peptostreptococcaceae bacterium]